MADEIRYQVTRRGNGWNGPGQRWLGAAITRLRLKLRRIDGPYTIEDQPREYKRAEVLAEVKRRMAGAHPGRRIDVKGSKYDQGAFVIRKVRVEDDTSLLVDSMRKLLGSPYLLGGYPPGPVDCSGATKWAVKDATGVDLPHMADLQMRDGRITTFRDPSNLQSGDFVFYNFGRLPDGRADHVALYVKPGLEIGSRPSTNGVGYHVIDWPYVLCYGRLK